MKGSCLCGSIKYEVSRLNSSIQHCACVSCRKSHSAAYNSAAAVRFEDFRWICGEEHLKGYESSPGKTRYFCSNCGSQLIAKKDGRDHLVLRVATLDEDPGVRPEMLIWKSQKAPWLKYEQSMPAYEEWEPGHN
jgi:hypothetical protein